MGMFRDPTYDSCSVHYYSLLLLPETLLSRILPLPEEDEQRECPRVPAVVRHDDDVDV